MKKFFTLLILTVAMIGGNVVFAGPIAYEKGVQTQTSPMKQTTMHDRVNKVNENTGTTGSERHEQVSTELDEGTGSTQSERQSTAESDL